MAALFDNSVTSNTGSATGGLTLALTVGNNSNRALGVWAALVGAPAGNPAVTAMTYNGVSLTKVMATRSVSDNFENMELWVITAPPVGANNLVVGLNSASNRCDLAVVSYYNVDQTTPTASCVSAAGNSTTPSVTINAATNDLVADGVLSSGGGETMSEGGGQTKRWFSQASDSCAGSDKAGAASVVMGWTLAPSTTWLQIGIAFKAAAAGFVPANPFTPMFIAGD